MLKAKKPDKNRLFRRATALSRKHYNQALDALKFAQGKIKSFCQFHQRFLRKFSVQNFGAKNYEAGFWV